MSALVLPIDYADPIGALPLPEDPAERAECFRIALGGEMRKLYLPGNRLMWTRAEEGDANDPLINYRATPIAQHYGAISEAECIAGYAVITSGDGRGDASPLSDAQFNETLAELLIL
ncbi:hypothetical protein ABZ569_33315 [Streptomyces albus]|uniref:hypothetical protein n=1 Tax=Streptomyces albus TaxID=1888 RepID=UPI0033DA80BA